MAATSGRGTMVTETAMAYRPRSAGGTSWESTSWSRKALTADGVVAHS